MPGYLAFQGLGVCTGRQLGRILGIPGYLVFWTLGVCVCRGDNSGGSQISLNDNGIYVYYIYMLYIAAYMYI